jgi:hypothetical protein
MNEMDSVGRVGDMPRKAKNAFALLPIILAGSWILSTSCAAGPYVEPTGPDSAEATFSNETQDFSFVNIYGDPAECTENQTLLMDVVAGVDRTIRIPANHYVALTVAEGSNLFRCTTTFDFYPTASGRYHIRFGLQGDKCLLQVTQMRDGGEHVIHVNMREYSTPFFGSSPSCEKDNIDRSKPPASPDDAK